MPVKGRQARAAAGPCRGAQDTRPQGCSASASLTNPPSPLHCPAWDQPAPPAAAGQGGTSLRAWLLPPKAPSPAQQGPRRPFGALGLAVPREPAGVLVPEAWSEWGSTRRADGRAPTRSGPGTCVCLIRPPRFLPCVLAQPTSTHAA